MTKLNELTLPELESLYNLVNNGLADGYSTEDLEVEAEGYQYGHENWKKLYKKREKNLDKIRIVIKTRIKEIEI